MCIDNPSQLLLHELLGWSSKPHHWLSSTVSKFAHILMNSTATTATQSKAISKRIKSHVVFCTHLLSILICVSTTDIKRAAPTTVKIGFNMSNRETRDAARDQATSDVREATKQWLFVARSQSILSLLNRFVVLKSSVLISHCRYYLS